MDAAAKYADLPGIAFDQPDCYETNDLPESDQPQGRHRTEDVSANVEIIGMEPADAFKRFEGKSLAVSGADFSGIPAGGKGYQSWGQWEVLERGQHEEETPLQKYRRLQIEVQELQQTFAGMHIPAAGTSDSKTGFAGDLRLEDICSDLKTLDTELKQLDCDSCVDSLISSTTSSKTLTQLEQSLRAAAAAAAPSIESKGPSVTAVPAVDSNALTYELTCSVDGRQSLSLHQLEERVRSLEQLLGSASDKVSLLTGATGAKSICEAVRLLSNKVLLMDPGQLDSVDSRLASILEKLSSISDKKTAVEDVEREARVNELIQLICETEGQRSALPVIAARLNSLSEVEEQAIQFSGAISYIDSLQSQITRDLTSSQQDLQSLKDNLNQNLSLFRSAVQAFEQQLDAVSK